MEEENTNSKLRKLILILALILIGWVGYVYLEQSGKMARTTPTIATSGSEGNANEPVYNGDDDSLLETRLLEQTTNDDDGKLSEFDKNKDSNNHKNNAKISVEPNQDELQRRSLIERQSERQALQRWQSRSYRDKAFAQHYNIWIRQHRAVCRLPILKRSMAPDNARVIHLKGLPKSGTTWLEIAFVELMKLGCQDTQMCVVSGDARNSFFRVTPVPSAMASISSPSLPSLPSSSSSSSSFAPLYFTVRHKHTIPFTRYPPMIYSPRFRYPYKFLEPVEQLCESNPEKKGDEFLMIIRDPRDSYLSWVDWRGGDGKQEYYTDTSRFTSWVLLLGFWYGWQTSQIQDLSPSTTYIFYEDMVEDPIREYRKIANLLDAGFSTLSDLANEFEIMNKSPDNEFASDDDLAYVTDSDSSISKDNNNTRNSNSNTHSTKKLSSSSTVSITSSSSSSSAQSLVEPLMFSDELIKRVVEGTSFSSMQAMEDAELLPGHKGRGQARKVNKGIVGRYKQVIPAEVIDQFNGIMLHFLPAPLTERYIEREGLLQTPWRRSSNG